MFVVAFAGRFISLWVRVECDPSGAIYFIFRNLFYFFFFREVTRKNYVISFILKNFLAI